MLFFQNKESSGDLLPSFDGPSRGQLWAEFGWELFKVVVYSLAIIAPIRYFLIQPFYVKGASMEPNFYDHEYLIIDEISYGVRVPFYDTAFTFNDPKRGEIVVFKYPQDPRQYFIKRIIALPGERIVIRDGFVYLFTSEHPTGIQLQESYLEAGIQTLGSFDQTLGPDEYFVLGDNRNSSFDSRSFGVLPRLLIVGKTWIRGWPFDRWTVFSTPTYF